MKRITNFCLLAVVMMTCSGCFNTLLGAGIGGAVGGGRGAAIGAVTGAILDSAIIESQRPVYVVQPAPPPVISNQTVVVDDPTYSVPVARTVVYYYNQPYYTAPPFYPGYDFRYHYYTPGYVWFVDMGGHRHRHPWRGHGRWR